MDDDLEKVYKEVAEEAQNYVSIIIRTGPKHTKQNKNKFSTIIQKQSSLGEYTKPRG